MEPVTSSSENLGVVTLEDRALLFVKQMKQAFSSDEDGKIRYDNFFFGMEDYKFRRISFEDLMGIVEDTFEGHEILLLQFKKFLPNNQETAPVPLITCENNNGYERNNEACIKYLKKVKDRSKKNPDVYGKFLTMLEEYEKGNYSVVKLYEKILKLFIAHIDLLEEFDYFLTDLDKKTRREIEKIKTTVIKSQLCEVKKAIKKGIDSLELACRVIECSDSIIKDEFIRDIEEYFSEDALESLRELHGGKSKALRKEFRKRPRKLFGDIINPRLKMEVKIRSEVFKKVMPK